MLKLTRRILAIVLWLGITFLFLDFTGTMHPYIGWMAKLQFLPSVLSHDLSTIILLIVLTLLLGRIYCSIICPLGVMQDFFAWIGKWSIFRKNKKAKFANNYSYSKPKTWLRISVLALFIIMLLAGVSAGVMLLAPYSSYGRIAASFLQPVYISANNLLASWSEANDNYMFYQVDQHNNPTILIIIAAVTAITLGILAFKNGRTYCNTICPVGTVLGYIAKFSFGKMRVDESKCIQCGLCAQNCKASCIKVKKGEPVAIDYARCVTCGNCETVCNKKAISLKYAPAWSNKKDTGDTTQSDNGSDISRRAFLSITGTAIATAAIKAQEKTTDGGWAEIEDKQIPERNTAIAPPGALSARNLQQHCTACQLCIANCPNGVLRPSQKLETLLQPEMQFDKGYCRPECTRCADVCPTGAIRPITKEEKTAIQIGHAVWVEKNCIPLTDGQNCGNCAKHCPTGAIQMIPSDRSLKQHPERGYWMDADGNRVNMRNMKMIPAINTEKCIGCGSCEYLCPARPFSAIYVEGHEQHREI